MWFKEDYEIDSRDISIIFNDIVKMFNRLGGRSVKLVFTQDDMDLYKYKFLIVDLRGESSTILLYDNDGVLTVRFDDEDEDYPIEEISDAAMKAIYYKLREYYNKKSEQNGMYESIMRNISKGLKKILS